VSALTSMQIRITASIDHAHDRRFFRDSRSKRLADQCVHDLRLLDIAIHVSADAPHFGALMRSVEAHASDAPRWWGETRKIRRMPVARKNTEHRRNRRRQTTVP